MGHQASSKSFKSQAKSKNRGSARKKQSSFLNFNSDSLWFDIQEFAKLKYQVTWAWENFVLVACPRFSHSISFLVALPVSFSMVQFELPEDARLRARKIPVIRNLCHKVALVLDHQNECFTNIIQTLCCVFLSWTLEILGIKLLYLLCKKEPKEKK